MIFSEKTISAVVIISFLVLATGCASTGADVNIDPWEGFNRSIFAFNDRLDVYVATPLAKGYKAITPAPVNRGITRFFANLDDVPSAWNNLLQFKFKRALSDVGRFGVNSTLGLLGFMDVATGMGLVKHDEDFGQTLGYWGFSSGPYLVLPIIGPSSVRDGIGFAGDWVTNPIYTRVDSATISWSLYGVRYLDRRADELGARQILEAASFDPYSFVRDTYLQHRTSQIYDGNPPQSDDIFDDSMIEE